MWNVEKHMSAEGHSFRNANYMFVNVVTGEETPLISTEEKELGVLYPTLSFLFNSWYGIYSKMENEIAREKTFSLFEDAIKTIVDKYDGLKYAIPDNRFAYDIIDLWYFGKLDPRFYYNERNNDALSERMFEYYNLMIQKEG